jgi:hypothetical protein
MKPYQLKCPICGAGWTLKRPTPDAMKLIAEAIKSHEANHRRIAVGGSKPSSERQLEGLAHPLR